MLWITVHSCIPSLFPLCLLMNNTFILYSFLFLQFHLNTLYFITEVGYNPASSDGHITATASYYSSVVMYCYLLQEIFKIMFFNVFFEIHYWTLLDSPQNKVQSQLNTWWVQLFEIQPILLTSLRECNGIQNVLLSANIPQEAYWCKYLTVFLQHYLTVYYLD